LRSVYLKLILLHVLPTHPSQLLFGFYLQDLVTTARDTQPKQTRKVNYQVRRGFPYDGQKLRSGDRPCHLLMVPE